MNRRRFRLRAALAVAAATTFALGTTVAGATPTSWGEVVSPHVSGNDSEIHAMTASGTDDVWAFGFDRAYIGGTFEWRVLGEHWDGASWSRLNTLDRETAPAQDFIWGASAVASNDVWIVGSSLTSPSVRTGRSLVEHWDGAHWAIDDSAPDPGGNATLLAVSARTSTDVWAVGEAHYRGSDYNGYVIHRDASGWSSVPFDDQNVVPGCNRAARGELDAVDAVGPDDVYVAGWCQSQPVGPGRGYVMHYDGTGWKLLLAVPHAQLHELASGPDGQVWAAGDHHESRRTVGVLYHGTAGSGFTEVPVRHSGHFAGPVDALSVSAAGVVVAGQIANPHDNVPPLTYALLLGPNGVWHREPVYPIDSSAYARVHASAADPSGTLWLGGTVVGGTHLDPQAMLARRR